MTVPKTKHKKNKVYYYEDDNTRLIFYYDKEKKLRVFPIKTGEYGKKKSKKKQPTVENEKQPEPPAPEPEPPAPGNVVPFTFPREYPPPMKQFVEQNDGMQPIINTSLIPEAGRGLFAEKDYPANAFVCYYEGKIYPSIVADLLDPTYQIEFIKGLTLDARKVDTPGRYINSVSKEKKRTVSFTDFLKYQNTSLMGS